MTWVRDYNDRLVNIDNWDVLDAITITDSKTDLPVLLKIFLRRNEEEYILGYIEYGILCVDDFLECISRGISISLKSIECALYDSLYKEFDETLGQISSDNFTGDSNKRYHEIDKLIGTRFKEDE